MSKERNEQNYTFGEGSLATRGQETDIGISDASGSVGENYSVATGHAWIYSGDRWIESQKMLFVGAQQTAVGLQSLYTNQNKVANLFSQHHQLMPLASLPVYSEQVHQDPLQGMINLEEQQQKEEGIDDCIKVILTWSTMQREVAQDLIAKMKGEEDISQKEIAEKRDTSQSMVTRTKHNIQDLFAQKFPERSKKSKKNEK